MIFRVFAIVEAARRVRNEFVALDSAEGLSRTLDLMIRVLSEERDHPGPGLGGQKLKRVLAYALDRIGIEKRHFELVKGLIEASVALYNAIGVFRTGKS